MTIDDQIFERSQQVLEELEDRSKSQGIYNNDQPTFKKHKLEFISFKDLRNAKFSPNKWIIDKLVPENGLTCFSGQPKVGKSFTLLYLAICLATGKPFLEKFQVEQSNILFVTKEDPARLINERIKLLTNEENLNIEFCTDNKFFLDTDQFIEDILQLVKNKNIKVVIIDSFRRIFKGEENSSQVISDVHNRLKRLTDKGLTIIFIHHHGKEGFFKKTGGDKLRGSSDILAMLDSLVLIEKKDEQTLRFKQEALRVDKPLPPFIIQFPTFKFVGYIEEEKEKKELAKQDILEFLKNGEANQKTIKQSLKEKSYGETTIKDALRDLLEDKKLFFKTEGREKIYFLKENNLDPTQEEFWNE